MSDAPVLNLEALEREEAWLRARLTRVVAAKELLQELAQGARPQSPVLQAVANSPASAPSPSSVWQPSLDADPLLPAVEKQLKQLERAFDGTFAGLIARYRTDPRSPYHALKHKVRANYEHSLKRLEREIGSERIADWRADRIQRIYDQNWAADGKMAMGHAMVAKLRLLSSFGTTVLNDDACIWLSAILSNMRFEVPAGRDERLTRDQVRAIRIAAREHFGWDSIALVQSIQFEFPMLRQVDIIGEWAPASEPGISDVTRENEKWLRGLRWSDIDTESMTLRWEIASKRKNDPPKLKEFDLKRFAMTMEELNRVPDWRRKGPLVICEFSGAPWTTAEFRRKWRMVADKAGVPKNIRFSDTTAEPEEKLELRAV